MNRDVNLPLLAVIIVAILVISQNNPTTVIFLTLLVVGGYLGYRYFVKVRERGHKLAKIQMEEEYFQRVHELLKQHAVTLARKMKQSILIDDYGVKDISKWNKEKEYFIQKVILNQLEMPDHVTELAGMHRRSMILETLSEMVDKIANEVAPQIPLIDPEKIITGEDYELHCAEILSNAGWTVRTTSGSGDQGADLFAEKGNLRVVIQCKYYSSNVGNKAVQEAIAAMNFYDYSVGAVVTNASYTRSARSLASKSRIHLLHQDDLSDLDSLF